jgi:hypothetical protein
MRGTPNYVYASMPDGSEVFGVDAFPFRRGTVAAVAFDVDGERRVLSETDSTFRLLDPATNERLPSRALWEQANTDAVLRRAIKERCGL